MSSESLLSRREWLRAALGGSALLALPLPVHARPFGRAGDAEDRARLHAWMAALHAEGLHRAEVPIGTATARIGELALGTPYEAHTLEAYLQAGGSPLTEPLTLWLTRFDCVTLVESCLAIARGARMGRDAGWDAFGREIERMRYRGGQRSGYTSRLHYFSEWITDNARRGLVRDLGQELDGEGDRRPLRFMTAHRDSYPALRHPEVFEAIGAMEQSLDASPRYVVPTARIPAVSERIQTGDILAFATSMEGLDVTHTGLAYRDAAGTLRVLHAPLSGGVVEVSATDLLGYVAAIRRATGILVARPL